LPLCSQVHQLLQLLKRDGDSDSTSGCSADMSQADSGRGGSDEGDKDRHKHTNPRPNGQQGQGGFNSNTIDKRRIAQINGGTGRNSPNKLGQGQGQGRSPVTYAVMNRNGRPASPGTDNNPRLPSPPPPPPAPTPTNKHATTDSSGGLGNSECPSPLCTCPADTKQQCMDIKQPIGSHGAGTPYEGIHLRTFSPSGYHSPSSGTLPRSLTPNNVNNSNRNSSAGGSEDGGGSSTSGSYVVDGMEHHHPAHHALPPPPPPAPMDPQQRAVDV
jgi:hypothetical protein